MLSIPMETPLQSVPSPTLPEAELCCHLGTLSTASSSHRNETILEYRPGHCRLAITERRAFAVTLQLPSSFSRSMMHLLPSPIRSGRFDMYRSPPTCSQKFMMLRVRRCQRQQLL